MGHAIRKSATKKQPHHENKTPWLYLIVFAIAIFTIYSGHLDNPPVFDSFQNSWIVQADNTPLFQDFFPLSARSISKLSFDIIVRMAPDSIVMQHMFNLLLHILNSFILFKLLFKFFSSALSTRLEEKKIIWLALAGAFFFAIHPVAVYGVAYLIQRSILLATLFSLLSFLYFYDGLLKDRIKPFLLSALFYFLAIHSKEHALPLPAVMVLAACFEKKLNFQQIKYWFARKFSVFVMYTLCAIPIALGSMDILGAVYEPSVQLVVQQSPATTPTQADLQNLLPEDPSWTASIQNQSVNFFHYIGLWLLPLDSYLSIDLHPPFLTSVTHPLLLAGTLLFLLWPVIWIRYFRQEGDVALLALAMLIPWVLFSIEFVAVRYFESFVLYRSYLWMPGLFFCLPFLYRKFIENFPAFENTGAFLPLMIAAFLMTGTSKRLETFSTASGVWKDAVEKFENSNTTDPRGFRAYNNLSASLLHENKPREALPYLKKALLINPKDFHLLHNLGSTYLFLRDHENAIRYFRSVLELKGDYFPTVYNLAEAHFQARQWPQAKAWFFKAHELESKNDAVLLRLAEIEWKLGQTQMAREHLEQARQLSPASPEGQRLEKLFSK